MPEKKPEKQKKKLKFTLKKDDPIKEALKNLDPKVEEILRREAVDDFIKNLNLLSLFQMEEEENMIKKIVPIANMVLLVVVLIKVFTI